MVIGEPFGGIETLEKVIVTQDLPQGTDTGHRVVLLQATSEGCETSVDLRVFLVELVELSGHLVLTLGSA
jgi:hypothetical protein